MMFEALDSRAFVRNMAFFYQNPGKLLGVPTGFAGLDDKLRGLRPKKLYTVAARPSMGKSALVGQMAYNQAQAGYRVFFWSIEMEALDMHNRMASMLTGIPLAGIETGHFYRHNQRVAMAQPDYTRYKEAGLEIAALPLFIREYPVPLSEIEAELEERKALDQLPHILYVDYLQVVPGLQGKAYDTLNANLVCLQAIAVKYSLPVVLVSQLSRGVEGRENKRPLLSDMEGSGHIEQASQAVILLYSDDYYKRQENPDGFLPTHKLEAMVAKNKSGKTGLAMVYYDQETQRLEDWHPELAEAAPDMADPPADVEPTTGEVLF